MNGIVLQSIIVWLDCEAARSLKHVDWILSHDSSMDTYEVAIGCLIISGPILMLFDRISPGSEMSKSGYDNGDVTTESSLEYLRRPSSYMTLFDT